MLSSIEMTKILRSSTTPLSGDNSVNPLIKPKRIRITRKIASNNIMNAGRIALLSLSLAALSVGAMIDNEYAKNILVRNVTIVVGALGIGIFVASFIPNCHKSYRVNKAITPINV